MEHSLSIACKDMIILLWKLKIMYQVYKSRPVYHILSLLTLVHILIPCFPIFTSISQVTLLHHPYYSYLFSHRNNP
jgi:hypothetical protein